MGQLSQEYINNKAEQIKLDLILCVGLKQAKKIALLVIQKFNRETKT